ncbi:MAG TPA: hypothetical protein VLV29_05190 [Steroidobacteraceae bacterium]|nr:hypothetical protein [Steroidobacteraceae bacterium]
MTTSPKPFAFAKLAMRVKAPLRRGPLARSSVLALSRLEVGESHSDWACVDLATLVAETADRMSLLALDKRLSVNCQCEGEVPVLGDRSPLKQLVINLLDNAIKDTPLAGACRSRCARKPASAA